MYAVSMVSGKAWGCFVTPKAKSPLHNCFVIAVVTGDCSLQYSLSGWCRCPADHEVATLLHVNQPSGENNQAAFHSDMTSHADCGLHCAGKSLIKLYPWQCYGKDSTGHIVVKPGAADGPGE